MKAANVISVLALLVSGVFSGYSILLANRANEIALENVAVVEQANITADKALQIEMARDKRASAINAYPTIDENCNLRFHDGAGNVSVIDVSISGPGALIPPQPDAKRHVSLKPYLLQYWLPPDQARKLHEGNPPSDVLQSNVYKALVVLQANYKAVAAGETVGSERLIKIETIFVYDRNFRLTKLICEKVTPTDFLTPEEYKGAAQSHFDEHLLFDSAALGEVSKAYSRLSGDVMLARD